jgi:hypothetical protein
VTSPAQCFYKTVMYTCTKSSAWALAIATCAALVSAYPTSADAQTRTIKKFGDWRVLTHDGPEGRICFAIAAPKTSEPPAAAPGAHFYVSAWPKEGVRAEISVKTSVLLKPNAPASIAIGQNFYKLFSMGDRAFVMDATDELKVLDAMKKGSSITVIAQSEQGVVSKDTYSLAGIAQALQSVSGGCK